MSEDAFKCANCGHEVEIIDSENLKLGIAECEQCGIKGLRKMSDTVQYMLIAIALIQEETDAKPEFEPDMDKTKKGCSGEIECPKCGKRLKYSVAGGNHHIWGACETDGCLRWMM